MHWDTGCTKTLEFNVNSNIFKSNENNCLKGHKWQKNAFGKRHKCARVSFYLISFHLDSTFSNCFQRICQLLWEFSNAFCKYGTLFSVKKN